MLVTGCSLAQCVGVAIGGVLVGEGLLYAGKYFLPRCVNWLATKYGLDNHYHGGDNGGDADGTPGAVQVLVHPDTSDDDQFPDQTQTNRVRFADTSVRHSFQGGQMTDSGVNMTTMQGGQYSDFTTSRGPVNDPDYTRFESPASASTPRSSKSTKSLSSESGARSKRLLRSKGRGVTSGYGHGEDTSHRKYPVTPGRVKDEPESPPPAYESLWTTAVEASDEEDDLTKASSARAYQDDSP